MRSNMISLSTLSLFITAFANMSVASQPQAAVYRGPAADCGEGSCADAVARLLQKSPSKFKVTFLGPDGDVDLTKESLAHMDVYAQPGGGGMFALCLTSKVALTFPDLDPVWQDMEKYTEIIREYVADGGHYLGFCVGAYLASDDPGFALLPDGDNVDEEVEQPKSQVKTRNDTVINVNWTFSTGEDAGKTQKRWVYFQDGAVMHIQPSSPTKILARYSSDNNVAATLSPFKKGWVGLVGPHPEADEDWCKYGLYETEYGHRINDILTDNGANVTNPEGIKLDIGYDFVETVFKGLY